MRIQRWHLDELDTLYQDGEGDFMLHDDHLTALARQRKEIRAMVEKALDENWEISGMLDSIYAGEGEEPAHFEWQCEWCGAKLTNRDTHCPCRLEESP